MKEKCETSYTANLNDRNVQISCLFFSNPMIEPVWSTKIKLLQIPTSTTRLLDELDQSLPIGQETSAFENVTPPLALPADFTVNPAVTIETEVTIGSQEDTTSNYASSIERVDGPNTALFRAVLTIKMVDEQDFKDYVLKFNHNEQEVNHVVTLKKTGSELIYKN